MNAREHPAVAPLFAGARAETAAQHLTFRFELQEGLLHAALVDCKARAKFAHAARATRLEPAAQHFGERGLARLGQWMSRCRRRDLGLGARVGMDEPEQRRAFGRHPKVAVRRVEGRRAPIRSQGLEELAPLVDGRQGDER